MGCVITEANVKLYIDGKEFILRKRPDQPPGTHNNFYTPFDTIYVDGNTGRTINFLAVVTGIQEEPGNGLNICDAYRINKIRVAIPGQNTYCVSGKEHTVFLPPGTEFVGQGYITYSGKSKESNDQTCGFSLIPTIHRTPPSGPCPIVCREEVVDIPSTRLEALVNDVGHQYNLSGAYHFTECLTDSAANKAAAKAIKDLILAQMSCDDPGLIVTVDKNWSGDNNCVRVTIKNSPIKMHYLKAGGFYYPFSLVKC